MRVAAATSARAAALVIVGSVGLAAVGPIGVAVRKPDGARGEARAAAAVGAAVRIFASRGALDRCIARAAVLGEPLDTKAATPNH